jgi:hypothetical protein
MSVTVTAIVGVCPMGTGSAVPKPNKIGKACPKTKPVMEGKVRRISIA